MYSACNYNKERFQDVKRSGSFKPDGNLDESLQLGDGFYKSETNDHPRIKSQNSFDRGHIIARRYTQWGDSPSEAKSNARETFYFTNIAPQTRELNQDEWKRLEEFVIEHGQLNVKKASIFSGAFLSDDDPIARYIEHKTSRLSEFQIPMAYWKVVFYQFNGQLRKIAFAMSQERRMQELDFLHFPIEKLARESIDPFDKLSQELKPFIVNSALIEKLTGLRFTEAYESFQEETPIEVIFERVETTEVDEEKREKESGPEIINSSIEKFI